MWPSMSSGTYTFPEESNTGVSAPSQAGVVNVRPSTLVTTGCWLVPRPDANGDTEKPPDPVGSVSEQVGGPAGGRCQERHRGLRRQRHPVGRVAHGERHGLRGRVGDRERGRTVGLVGGGARGETTALLPEFGVIVTCLAPIGKPFVSSRSTR